MDTAFLIPVFIFLLCLAIRDVYESLKQKRKVDLESKLIFVFIFTAMCLLWISWFSLCPLDPFRFEIPDAIGLIGLGIFLAGLLLAFSALFQLKGVENIDHLVTTGMFRKLRHPMYVGFVSWIFGWSIFHGAFLALAIGLPGIASILWWRHLEESRLEMQFGDAYRQYRLSSWF